MESQTDASHQADGLITLPSDFGPKETMDRLEADIKAQGMQVFARIDHAALASKTGMNLPPTELLIFGNPHAGTPLMHANQTIGIDLPLKALVWQDLAGKTWLTYNHPDWFAQRHGIGVELAHIVASMALALAVLAKKATEPQ